MNTTNIFSELLIVGAGGIAWYTLLITMIFGPEPILYIITDGSINEFIAIGITFVFAYFFGVLLDRAYVPLWSWYDKRLQAKTFKCLGHYQKAQVKIATHGESATNNLLHFNSSRIRILRASMINFLLIAIFGCLAYLPHTKVATFIFINATIISLLCFCGFKQLSRKLYLQTKVAAKLSITSKK